MKQIIKNLTLGVFRPSTSLLVCIVIFFICVFSFGDGRPFYLVKLMRIFEVFFKSDLFAYIGMFSAILLIARLAEKCTESSGLMNRSMRWNEKNTRDGQGWPSREEEFVLESLFYSGITFDELHKFVHWASGSHFVAFTENSVATVQNYTLLVRDEDKYWLSYFRFSYRETNRIRMLYLIISNFMEELTGEVSYIRELEEQKKSDPELKNVDVSKLLIAIVNKDEITRYLHLCDKYYKMMIDKRVANKL